MTGQSEYVATDFGNHNALLHAGVLLAIPALLAQGLNKAFSSYQCLKAGYYGLHHVIILSCLMALLRIKNVEGLKGYPPGELGKILGLDRVPEVGHLRKKFQQVFKQERTDQFHQALFAHWVNEMPEYYFYIDGHVRVYSGNKANLPKHYVSRQKLCLNATTEFWVNTQDGAPLMVLTAQLNEKLKEGVNQILPEIKKQLPAPADTSTPRFTIVLDRESYEPAWYKSLWTAHQIAVITYRKNVQDKWAEAQFQTIETQIYSNNVTLQICEMGTQLGGHWFTEIRVLSKNGHQTAIITTNHQTDPIQVATKMFTRWKQENFFKYMIENFDFDKMIEYGTEPVHPEIEVVNPQYRKLTYQIKKSKEKKNRRQARVYEKMQQHSNQTIEQVEQVIAQTTDLIDELMSFDEEIEQLKANRKQVPARIKVAEMDAQKRYERLKTEGKKFKNTILMLSYRAETALYNSLPTNFKNAKKEGRALLREIFRSQADISVDHQAKTLTIKFHSLSTPRFNQALKHLCSIMNDTKTIYPHTNLQMLFKTIAA